MLSFNHANVVSCVIMWTVVSTVLVITVEALMALATVCQPLVIMLHGSKQ